MTSLHMSALGGYTDCCRLLISNGGNVNSIDGNDRTPLHCATVSGSHECMQLLIRQGNNHWMKSVRKITEFLLVLIFPYSD